MARGMLFGVWPRAGWGYHGWKQLMGPGIESQSKLWDFFDDFGIEQAVMHVTGEKLKSLAAGSMGFSTSEVGDLVADRAVNG